MLLPAHFLKMFIGTTKTTQQMIQLEFFNYDVNRLVVCFVVFIIGFSPGHPLELSKPWHYLL